MIRTRPRSRAARATATTAAANAKCDGVTLEATDTGVTADTITIQVMADTGSPLAPGLFQGNVDALKGFEKYINANGGIGCRQLKVETWDSKLTPDGVARTARSTPARPRWRWWAATRCSTRTSPR